MLDEHPIAISQEIGELVDLTNTKPLQPETE
jgi:hypothetical protein